MTVKKKLAFFYLFVLTLPAHAQSPSDTLRDVRPFGTHALEQLTAREPGVEVISSPGAPGMTTTIHIRGFGAVPGLEPVYVVDGMRRRDLEGIAPESIEKIEVLKNASAIGLWGADAAAGVVVVTTKCASQKGFHAGYDFIGGIQSLAHEPARMTLDDWRKYSRWEEGDKEYDIVTPVTSFVQNHHLYAQYGGERLSAYADFSLLDNDGPYPGRADTHRRYAATWSVSYRPLKWLSLETSGRWGRGKVSQAKSDWLRKHLAARPVRSDYSSWEYQYTDRRELSETVVQGKVDIHPFPGLYVRGTGGYSGWTRPQHTATWKKDYTVEAKAGHTGGQWYQWGAEAGWSGEWRGHRLNLGATFRRTKEKQDNLVLGTSVLYSDYGLTFGDDDHLEEKFLLPEYEKFLAAGGGIDGWQAAKLNSISAGTPELKWKEGILQAGYGYKGRIRADFSYYACWEDELSKDRAYLIPALTVGWTPSAEPLLRRLLPDWWESLSVEASWARPVKSYLPAVQMSRMYSLFEWRPLAVGTLDTAHRDLDASASFRLGNARLDLSGAWFVYDDGLTLHDGVSFTDGSGNSTPINWDDRYYNIRNRGVELSAAFQGKAGAFRYAVDGHLTLYRNLLTFGEGLGALESLTWTSNAEVRIKDGEPVGGYPYYKLVVDGDKVSQGDEGWGGNTFPTLTGGMRASLGWNRWQLTVSGHGAKGQTILHLNQGDALTRYYLETTTDVSSMTVLDDFRFVRSERSILDAPFFRIDQIRLDYTLPLRNKVRLNLFASLENWFLFTRYGGSDPELALAWDGLGVETARYPSTRRTLFGLAIGF